MRVERLVGGGLVGVHVQTGGADLAALQTGEQGGLVDVGAAGGVDDDDAVLHLGNALGIDERAAVDRGSVAVDDLAVLLGEDDLVQRGAVGAQDAGEVHKFAEAENFGTSDRLFHFLRADDCAGMLERRGGDTGGEHVLDVERSVLRGVDHVIEARQAADVDDLVRVGNDGGAAVGDKASSQAVDMAMACGMTRKQAVLRVALRLATPQLVSVIGLTFAQMVTGVMVVENLFALPGLGTMLVTDVGNRDLIAVQSELFLLATFFLLLGLVVDVVHRALDPRLKDAGLVSGEVLA